MTCERWRDAISCIVDGEPTEIEADLVAAHVARCAGCRTFQSHALATRRMLRLRPAPAMPDLAPRIVRLHTITERIARWPLARAVLAVVAIEIVVASGPALILARHDDAAAHASRHLGAFSVAYGVALLVVVVRPARARTVLPVALVLAGTLTLTAIVDGLRGQVPLLGETWHLPEVLSVVLVWIVAAPSPRGRRQRKSRRPTGVTLRLVDDTRRTG
jgi:predicted anti-sigma-YlaC factor YlaD